MIYLFALMGCSNFNTPPDESKKPPLADPVSFKIIYNSLMYGEIEPCG